MSDWHPCGLATGLDAYADWAIEPGRDFVPAFDKPGCYIPALIRLNGCTAEAFRQAVETLLPPHDGEEPCLCLPKWYESGSGSPHHLSALVTEAFFDVLAENGELRGMVRQLILGQRLDNAAVNHHHDHHEPEGGQAAPSGPPRPGTVVVGVIDDAIAFAHEQFQLGDGTPRVEYAWVQDLDRDSPYASSAVPYGRQFDKQAIKQLLDDHRRGGFVDEDGLYRAAGLIDFGRSGPKPPAWRLSHGTHVMHLACGKKPEKADDKRPIACVQLPAAVTADTSGAGLAPYLLDGISYILERADDIARDLGCGRLPVVINISYGFLAGPHDGTHPIELAIDEVIRERRRQSPKAPLAMVLPAGNSNLARCHAEVSFKEREVVQPDGTNVSQEGEEVTLDWRILPDDRTSTFLEIWLPHGAADDGGSRVDVAVAPPGHGFSPALPEGAADDKQALVWQPDGHVLCKMSYELVASSQRGRFLVAVRPTAFHDGRSGLAPSGLWRIKLTNRSLARQQAVHLWIQRDDTPHGYPVRGRQSYFEDEEYERFDAQGRVVLVDNDRSTVRRAGAMNAIATGSQTVVIGGFVRKEDKYGVKRDQLARYSAGGPVTPPASGKGPHRQGPDAVAVCDESQVHWGVLAAGSRSGSVVAMNGTSVAAPQVARWIAEQFADSAAGGAGKALAITMPEGAVHARAIGKAPAPPPVPQGGPPPAFVREGAGLLSLPPIVPLHRYEP